uniref:RBR-type E3 ubiquitin transferase n=1 Tax=Aureoumbra lagunensis TaxID=44058 RepID=A0A7S3JR51_9STRA|mmetsp:Transcript_19187/g.24897  ORF Transcript_19187/g.24897 Transcript_19187/m.24897 type:complete len:372 (-) Transcript_19187:307-1422(-)
MVNDEVVLLGSKGGKSPASKRLKRKVINLVDDDDDEFHNMKVQQKERKRQKKYISLDDDDDDVQIITESRLSKKKERKALVREESSGLMYPKSRATCPICFCETEKEEAVSLRLCGCVFCQECITMYVRGKVKEGEVLPAKLSCPALIQNKQCNVPLHQRDVHALLRNHNKDSDCKEESEVARYERLLLARTVELNSDQFACCPTAGCDFLFAYDREHRKLECPRCNKSFCLICRVAPWHTGMRCEEYQTNIVQGSSNHGNQISPEDVEFAKFSKSHKLKQCPKCNHWIEKNGGCMAMHCRCGLVFCYRCGGGTQNAINSGLTIDLCKCNGGQYYLDAHERSTVNHNLISHEQHRQNLALHDNLFGRFLFG